MAYTYLKDLRLSDTNIVEVKLIAGFITYKLCYLMFKLNQPKDSINHFKFHIDYFKPKVGCKDLLFEHYSWLSKQYSAFADIFDDAVSQVNFTFVSQLLFLLFCMDVRQSLILSEDEMKFWVLRESCKYFM